MLAGEGAHAHIATTYKLPPQGLLFSVICNVCMKILNSLKTTVYVIIAQVVMCNRVIPELVEPLPALFVFHLFMTNSVLFGMSHYSS